MRIFRPLKQPVKCKNDHYLIRVNVLLIFVLHFRVKLKHFEKFADTTEALAAATAAVEGKLSKALKKTLKKHVLKDVQEQLLVADAKLGNSIKDKLSLQCVSNTNVQELMRCIRSQADSLIAGLPKKEMAAMALGLAHRYRKNNFHSFPLFFY